MRQFKIQITLGLLLVSLFLANTLQIVNLRFMDQLELWSYDTRLRLTAPSGVDRRIVIVDIDEKSLAREGRWPWGRDKLAALLDQLFLQQQVSVVGFDVVFAEPDESSGLKVLEQLAAKDLKSNPPYLSALNRLKPQLDRDRQFADRLGMFPVVLGYYFTLGDGKGKAWVSGQLPPPSFPPGAFGERKLFVSQANGYGANLPVFQQSGGNAGHMNPQVDFDGISRRVPMLIEYQGGYYESLSLAVTRIFLNLPAVAAIFADDGGEDYGGLEWLKLGKLKVPVDEATAALVPFRGGQGSFRYVPATDVLHGLLKPGELKNAIILIGTTAPGLMDLRATPVASVYPGVEVHANMIAGILDQNIKLKPAYVLAIDVLTLLIMGLLLVLLLPRLSPLKSSLSTLFAIALLAGLNLLAWQEGNMVLPIAGPMLMIFLLYALDMSWGYFAESRIKKQIAGLFGQYIPPELVDEMSKNPASVSMEGESRNMTVLFSDIRNFTSLSEKLEPKQLSELMNAYLTPMTQVIHKHRGTIDKYIGDAIMAFWGAPLADEDHARNALLAGMEMQARLTQLMQEFEQRGWPTFKIGVGLNTGLMTVGNMGSEFRRAYTVMGDTVNLASRLESLTKQYGIWLIVGEDTKNAVPDMEYRELDRVQVKGKQKPVTIYEPLGSSEQIAPEIRAEVDLFQQAVAVYRTMEWNDAESLLRNLLGQYPDKSTLYQLYLDRISHFREHPPEADWDGVFVFQSK